MYSLLALLPTWKILQPKKILGAVNTLGKDGAISDNLSTIFSRKNMVASRGGEKLHFRIIVVDHGVTAASLPSCIVECVELAEILITSCCLKPILAILRKRRSRKPIVIVLRPNHIITSARHFTLRQMG